MLTRKEKRKIYREWDKQREKAVGVSDRQEIDAIFAREIHRLEQDEHDRV
jgi:hypothetical protein